MLSTCVPNNEKRQFRLQHVFTTYNFVLGWFGRNHTLLMYYVQTTKVGFEILWTKWNLCDTFACGIMFSFNFLQHCRHLLQIPVQLKSRPQYMFYSSPNVCLTPHTILSSTPPILRGYCIHSLFKSCVSESETIYGIHNGSPFPSQEKKS